MTELKGAPVAAALTERCRARVAALEAAGITPKLAVVRVGEREDDVSYEKGIVKRFSAAGAAVEPAALPPGTTQAGLEAKITSLNRDESVHGILLFRPLPSHLSPEPIKALIAPEKDVDCMGTANTARVFEGSKNGYVPCTAGAVIELLDFYGIGLAGRKVTIIGRSLVVGRPLAMLLLARDATVTVCHTKTCNLAEECRRSDILIACAGSAGMVGADFARPGQIVIDVGINMAGGKLRGDVDYGAVAGIVEAITPVPSGVGAVTTAVLLEQTVWSAMKLMYVTVHI